MASPSFMVCAAVRGTSFGVCAHSWEVVTRFSLCRNCSVRFCKSNTEYYFYIAGYKPLAGKSKQASRCNIKPCTTGQHWALLSSNAHR